MSQALSSVLNVPDKVRTRHIYIAGKTRHGKSNLIFWMALQDIDQGKGVCVLDPHGDLVRKIIHYIPEHRVEDTIYLDFTKPIPLDFFYAETAKEKSYLADDIVSTFRRIAEGSWGIRMDSILRNVVIALLAHPNTTFLDIHRMIVDKGFRQQVIRRSGNFEVKRYFSEGGDFDKERADSKVAITSRMSKFLLTPMLNTIVGHPEPKLKIPQVMETKKVFLVNLNEMAEETKMFIGTLIVARIQQAAMQRSSQRPEDRVPFYLYADEFQKFQTTSFEEIITEAGKFKLCLALAHQGIWQFKEPSLKSAMRAISTFVFFRLDEDTARFFKSEIRGDYDLQGLRVGEAVYRAANGYTTLVHTPEPPPYSEKSFAEIIKKRTIDLYSCELPKDALGSKEEDSSGSPRRLTRHAHSAPTKDSSATS